MSNGKLFQVDTPFNIKNQFGVGYKLVFEPKDASIKDLKNEHIEKVVLTEKNLSNNIKEHYDTSDIKYVY